MTADSPALRKARGAFFTPPELANYVANWAVRTPGDAVLEPSCGDAAFLLAAGKRMCDLGGGSFFGASLVGVELDWPSAEVAKKRLADAGYPAAVSGADFFDSEPNEDPLKRFDAVIGNPPYIRYQSFAGSNRMKAMKAALMAGVRLTGLASAWAPFVIHASRFVRPGGRMGLVLPAELLTVGYASEVRRFLLERFAHVRLVMFEELVFPGVQEEVVLLLAEGAGGAPHFELYQSRNIVTLTDTNTATWTTFAPDSAGKWSGALVSASNLQVYNDILASGDFCHMTEWGSVYLGAVSGANKFFTLTVDEVRTHGIPNDELLSISPPGSRHLRGLSFTESSWQELAEEGRPVYLLYPRDKPSEATARYLGAGVAAKIDKGYKCSNRVPWWRVPLVDAPDLFLTYMDKDRPRLVTNRAKVDILNSVYGVRLKTGYQSIGKDLLPIASLNSMTLVGAEVVGRAYGGGMLKLEPKEADRLPLPSLELLRRCADELRALQPHLSNDLRRGDLDAAVSKVDRVVLTRGLGLTHEKLAALREARAVLFGRRESRSNGTC